MLHPPRSRAARIVLRVIGSGIFLALLAAGAGFYLLQRYVTPEWLQSVITAQLQQTFQRPVHIRRVSVVLQRGIRVDGLSVSEDPAFPGETFLSSEALLIRYKVGALLHGRLELSSVQLVSPRIELVRRADGTWNIEALLHRPTPPRGLFALPPLQSADELRIEDGELLVRDLARGRSYRVEALRAALDDVGLEKPFPVEADFRSVSVVGGRRIDADVSFSGVVSLAGLRRPEAYVAAKRFVVKAAGRTLELSGSLRDLDAPRLELRVKLPPVDSAWLSAMLPVPAGLSLPGGALRLKLSAPSSGLPLLERPYVLEQLEGDLGFGRLFVRGRLEGLRSGKATVSMRGLDLARAAACWKPWAAKAPRGTLSGSVSFSGPVSSPSVSALALDLREFGLRISSGQSIAKVDLSLKGAREMRDLELVVRGGSYVGLGNEFSDVRVAARIRDGDLDLRDIQATWHNARAKAVGCVRRLTSPREVVFDATVDRLRTDELYAGIEKSIALHHAVSGSAPSSGPWARVFKHAIPRRFPDLRGRIRVANASSPNFDTQNLELLLDLKDIQRGLRHVNGSFRAAFGPGRVTNVQSVREAHRVLNVLLLPFTYMHEMNAKAVMSLDTATPKTLDFNRVFGDFTARDGLVDVHLLNVDGPQFVGYADGDVDFSKERIAAKVLMRLTKSRGQLPDRLVDTTGRPAIELQLSDDLNKPSANITLRKMGSSDIEDALALGMKRIAPLDPLSGGLCGDGKER